jgi:AcrR family transcriptional regulator
MAGRNLRERKRDRRRRDIIAAASHLFQGRGFDATSIEEIAALAEVSVGTVYNYFPSKSELLSSIFVIDFGERQSCSENVDTSSDLAPVINAVRSYFEWVGSYDRALLRRYTADCIATPALGESGYFNLEQQMVSQLTELMVALSEQGKLRPQVQPDAAARLVFHVANSHFYNFLVSDESTPEQTLGDLAKQLELLQPALAPSDGS